MDNITENKILEKFKSDCESFSADTNYRKQLAKACGLNDANFYLLRPVIGENEFLHLTNNLEEKNFMPGKRKDLLEIDSHDDEYLKNGEFRANLHIHTVHSDGRLTTDELLDQAVQLANKNFGLNKKEPPLLLAITDHDCIDGTKEILKKIIQNPIKYENIRIVLGIELSTITNKFNNLKKPLLIHTHMFCINPFDKTLNEFIDKKRTLKYNLAKETINKLNGAIAPILKSFNIKLTLEEASLIHELVTKGQDEVYLPMKKYVGGKLLFENYVFKNKKTLVILKSNNINLAELSYHIPYTKYKYLFKQGGGYTENYKIALNKFLKDLVQEKNNKNIDFSDIINIRNEQVENAIKLALDISKQSHPSLTDMPEAFDGFEDTLSFLSQQNFGVFSIAHPGRTIVKDVDSDLLSLFENMFCSFKEYGKTKARYYEGYYQAYNGKKYLDYLTHIEQAAKKFKLVPIGGLDSHGESITCRGGNP